MFDSMRIRTKLAVALVIPLVALIGLSGVAISSANEKADEATAKANKVEDQVALATSSLGPGGLVTALQDERNGESIEFLGLTELSGGESPEQLRAATDKALADFTAKIESEPQSVQQVYAPALAAVATIPDLRAKNDAYTGAKNTTEGIASSDESFLAYSDVIDAMFDANSAVATAIDDTELRAGATFFDQFARQNEAQALGIRVIASQLFAPSPGGLQADPDAYGDLVEQMALASSIEDQMVQSPSAAYRDIATKLFTDSRRDVIDQVIADGLAGNPIDAGVFSSPELTAANGIADEVTAAASERLQADAAAITSAAQAEADSASSRAQTVTLVTLIVLALAVIVTLLVSRSITRPLGRLVRDAEDMAKNRLPETVDEIQNAPLGEDVQMPELTEVSSAGGYEIAEVAAALNTVQASAADLAVEQAVLRRNISDSFVNLGRRNQNLLSRQLDSITEMEREESDPAELQKLFTLDHLATRMRRNAESLLLLAGLEPHRQWSAPVALIDVLRGSLGEVEDYDRVEINRLDEATVNGQAAADLTHLVAELLENALNFSPPGRNVEMVGNATATGYTLRIIDNGVGMERDDLAQANVRLAGAESFTVAPSRYLGHYVVGIQAARLGVKVSLVDTPEGGITAVLDITAALATDETEGTDVRDLSGESFTPDRFARAHEVAEAVEEDTSPLTAVVPDSPAGLEEDIAVAATASTPAAAPEAPEVATTASGYTKRVRGANTPRTEVLSARGNTSNGDTPPADEAPQSTAESLGSMLSGFQAGAERAQSETNDDETEEGR